MLGDLEEGTVPMFLRKVIRGEQNKFGEVASKYKKRLTD